MAGHFEIADMAKFLAPSFPGRIITRRDISRLLLTGQNYGSLLLAVGIDVRHTEQHIATEVELVAKTMPENECLQKFLNLKQMFTKEYHFYKFIAPTLIQFLKDERSSALLASIKSIIPKCYGVRLNRTFGDVVDNDAVVLLENLRRNGYGIVGRDFQLNLQLTEHFLQKLAQFHGVGLAMRLKNPLLFTGSIKPFLGNSHVCAMMDDAIIQAIIARTVKIAGENPNCAGILPDIEKTLHVQFANLSMKKGRSPPVDDFTTLIHNDFWSSNLMIKYLDKKQFVSKIIDWQLIEYGSAAKDLLFFLFSSVQTSIIETDFNRLVKLYHYHLAETLRTLECSHNTRAIHLDAFEKEMEYEAKTTQFLRTILILNPLFLKSENIRAPDQLTVGDFNFIEETSELEQYKTKLFFIIFEYAKRMWIV